MKRMLASMLAAACTLALSFALIGCGEADYSKNFAGDWKLCSMEDENGTTSEDEVALLEAFGMSVTLNLSEDGIASLSMMGDTLEGTWEAVSATECTVTIEGDAITGTLTEDQLSLGYDGQYLMFEKMTAEEAAEMAESTAALSTLGEAIEEDSKTLTGDGAVSDPNFKSVTIADDDVCTITVTGKMTDEWGDNGYVMDIANKTDKTIYVTIPFDSATIDGVMVDFWGGETLMPGASVTDAFFYVDSDDVASLNDITNVAGVIEVWDDNTYDTLGSYDFTLN